MANPGNFSFDGIGLGAPQLHLIKAGATSQSIRAVNQRPMTEGPDGSFYARANTPAARVFWDVEIRDPKKAQAVALQTFYTDTIYKTFRVTTQFLTTYICKWTAAPELIMKTGGANMWGYRCQLEITDFVIGNLTFPPNYAKQWHSTNRTIREKPEIGYSQTGVRYRYDRWPQQVIWEYSLKNMTTAHAVNLVGLMANNFRAGLLTLPLPQELNTWQVYPDFDEITITADASEKWASSPLRLIAVAVGGA